MTFGEALEALKIGEWIARSGWNGKGMHLYLEEDLGWKVETNKDRTIERKYEPVICMYTAQGRHQPGWLASQADMLADDWMVIIPEA